MNAILSLSLSLSLSLMITPSALGSDDDTPLGPGGESGGSPGEWIPIGQPGENDEGSCGEWSWHPNRPGLVSTDRPTAPSPFPFGTIPRTGKATWAVGFEQTGPDAQRALQARCSLKARVTMGDFYFERQECPCLDPVTGGGPQQAGGAGGGLSGGGGG
jgi:hypothetical protein